ncbi:uncharacterized protein LOC107361313 [Tetranychus urticae]|uniref:uncharacterized protein LOC107361313 n=1 Tax=Tetranychus urticae TaxID=32264 RepID=UPI000D657435|nr:uncharacterized protein LOC107361313 [Tetranychus urticae]
MANNVENCEKVLIINRKRKYRVPKKQLLSVPYFEKMFSSDCVESQENKVKLDFDERVFDSIISWILSGQFNIRMEYAISFYEAADYLMINERFLEPCLSHFLENFTIENIPVLLPQVTKVSKFFTSGVINNICRHFLMITNTDIFLNYPVETVEAILKLDLMVHSEYQIFESIMKWVYEDVESRKELLPRLLACVRWAFMDHDDICKIKNNELIKALPNFDEIISSNGECAFDRSDQSFFLTIHQKADATLLIKILNSDFICLSIGDFTQDDSISLEFVNEDHVSDILFDSGTKGIRIDWIKKTFRWLDFKGKVKTYYSNLIKFLVEFSDNLNYLCCYLEDADKDIPETIFPEEELLLESNGVFILIGKTKCEKQWFGLFPVAKHSWFNDFRDQKHSFHATVLDNTVYILTKDLEFIQYDYETQCFEKNDELKEEKFKFNDLILISHKKNDEVILVNKASGKVYVFCSDEEKWIEKFRIMNINLCTDSSGSDIDKLVAFTSTFLPMQFIEPLYYESSEDSILTTD